MTNLTPKYVKCGDCDHGIIYSYRDAADGTRVVETWFVCGVCEGSGKVAA